jgi:hypothetical protein
MGDFTPKVIMFWDHIARGSATTSVENSVFYGPNVH